MTLLGKVFVLLNLALSLVLATLAFGVYSNGIDWSSNSPKGGQPGGRFYERKEEIDKKLVPGSNLAFETWRTANKELLTKEEQRRFARQAYAQELAKLRTFKGPVQMVALDLAAGDQLRLVPAEEAPGVPLQGMPVYVERLEQIRKENERIRKELDARVKEDTELTNQLTGDPERKTKGLRRLLTEERAKQEGLIAEIGIEESLRINREVEAELILKRFALLQERIHELEALLKLKQRGKKIEEKGEE